jgi:hypothetical protein
MVAGEQQTASMQKVRKRQWELFTIDEPSSVFRCRSWLLPGLVVVEIVDAIASNLDAHVEKRARRL